MKKSTRTLLGTATAAALGALLILGGTGSLAFWSDSSTSTTQQIQSGSLDLGTATGIDLTEATIKNCNQTPCTSGTYTGSPLVPGDTVTGTAYVPVKLVGANISAKFTVVPTATAGVTNAAGTRVFTDADTALAASISVKATGIKPNGETGATVTGPTASLGAMERSIPVVFEVSLPSNASNATMGGRVSIVASYTLTQTGAA